MQIFPEIRAVEEGHFLTLEWFADEPAQLFHSRSVTQV
jgi:hypothetical protein